MRREWARRVLGALVRMEPERRMRLLKSMPPPALRALAEEWWWQAHGGQEEPQDPDWRVWAIMAGRGFGKTRTGAEWVSARAREHPDARIALVGGTMADVEAVMIEGPSGILSVARTDEKPDWRPSRGRILFPSGAAAFPYSGERPDALRGPEHHFAWADELAKWRLAEATWDILQMGLRRGERPRTIVTTTPRAGGSGGRLLKRILGGGGTVLTRGATEENVHLPGAFIAEMESLYGGTRLGRQELEGELIEDVEGSLFPRDLLERCRVAAALPERRERIGISEPPTAPPYLKRDPEAREPWWRGSEFWRRIVVGVDPPGSASGDACGIVVCGLGADGIGYVLADCTAAGLRPDGWARAVVRAAERWEADRVVAEKNQGGEMVESVLRSVDERLPVTLVHASRGKAARAEPVAARFESGKAKLAGCFPELEDELCGLTAGGGYEGPGRSPDRADACVWALTELLLGRERAEPRISMF